MAGTHDEALRLRFDERQPFTPHVLAVAQDRVVGGPWMPRKLALRLGAPRNLWPREHVFLAGVRPPKSFNVDLLHLKHGSHDSLGLCRIGVSDHLDQDTGNNLP